MKQRLLNLTKLFLGWPITIVAFFFIYKIIYQKTTALSFSFSEINVVLLTISVFCFLAYFSFRVILWQHILLLKNHHTSFLTTAFYWSSSEIKRFVPGNIWSLFSRIDQFSNKQISKKEIFQSIIEEAKIVVLSSLTVSIFSFSFVFSILFPSAPLVILVSAAWTTVATLVGIYLYLYPKKHQLLLYGMASFFFFSLGTYLSIASVIALSPIYITTFVSFFSFCYLVGYLSFVVPMGLGVREAVMTIGLSKFIAEQTAAIASVYTRIILIITELLFFSLTFFLYKTADKSVKKTIDIIGKHWHIILLGFGIFFYILYFSSASIARHDNFYSGRFDLGNMVQTVWNTSNGRLFQLTDPNGTEIISRLAFHADFILILLAPFYKLWSDPRLLLVMQTIVLAYGSIFVYLIAKNIFSKKSFGILFALLFLLNPYLQHANLYDFHAVTFATTFLLGAFYFLQKKGFFYFLLFSTLAGLTKENVWLVISLFGGYMFVRERKNIQTAIIGISICIIAAFLFYYLVWIAIPNARGTQHFAISYYADFGSNPTSVIKTMLFSPAKIITTALQPDRILYLFQLFLPTGFIAFFSPLYLLFISPDFAINLLSNNSQLRQLYYHYSSVITPFIFIASMFGAKNIQIRFPKIAYYLPIYLIFAAVFGAYQYGPLPGAKNPNLAMFSESQNNKDTINKFLSHIDENLSVAATNNLGSHLSHRQKIFTIPIGTTNADMLVFLLNDPHAQPSLASQRQMVAELKHNNNYILVFEKDDFVVFKRK